MAAMFDAIADWDNLWRAWRQAARGKRGKEAVAGFELHVADHLLDLQEELRAGHYRPGAYRHFHVREPKHRKISAAPFRDRVVHHALCNVIEPLFERGFIAHSYANRRGKGTHRAVDQLQHWMRQYRYALRADIVQHFPSIDHAILQAKLSRLIDDEAVIAMVRLIIGSGEGVLAEGYSPAYFDGDDLFAVNRPRGLPIGNLTSQFWSNVYLNDFDWFVVRELGCGAYLRYVDDMVLLSDSKTVLRNWRAAILDRLASERLRLHEAQCHVVQVEHGLPWLGFVVYPDHRRLKGRNAVRFTRRFVQLIDAYRSGRISFAELDASVQGWINHVRSANTWGLRDHVFGTHPIRSSRVAGAA